ncbi:myosin-binding protein 2-like [Rutidosis leptorrhynchoides]|uniref:myosin-binding protein 2-like n=1 Tax=Rutidosis leptorrhynchoides TaxID=125765 RepID=UPI003A99548A
MVANKFATMLHNNTNRITLILIYVILEWTLIILLLLNSVFSYLIIKFAHFFGLNTPCFSCARIHRLPYHLCELHSKEVSQMGFCSNHKKLAEFHDLCNDCSSSVLGSRVKSTNFMFSKVERIDVIHLDENDEVNLKCSCCDVNFEKKFIDDSSCFVVHPVCDNFDSAETEDIVIDHVESHEIERQKQSIVSEELETGEYHAEVMKDLKSFEENLIQLEKGEDLHFHDLQFFADYSGNQLFPFEILDLKTEEALNISVDDDNHELHNLETEEVQDRYEDDDHEFGDFQKAQENSQEIDDFLHQKTEESSKFVENLIDFGNEEGLIDEETQIPLINMDESHESDSDIHSVHEEDDVSIGAEIPVLDSSNEIKHDEHNNLQSSFENDLEDTYSVKNIDEIEEEKAPETPSSMHSSNPFHKKWLMHETNESGGEESFDGSLISDTDNGDLVMMAEKLKLALNAERRALQGLYLELEEERNASMVATNEAMFMITRLQEEKAAVQMEALQYQRMMEEQSEYDQEALQLLNEHMMKKEKELELYRKKVLDLEAKEKIRVSRMSTKTRTSSLSWSHSEDEDGSSMDLYQVPKVENTLDANQEIEVQNTPIDSVLDLVSTLGEFEEERMSILEQLKILEEKLFALSDEEDRHFGSLNVIDHYEEIDNYSLNGHMTESTKTRKQAMGKRLLPLFDSISHENEDGVTVRNGYENGFHSMKFDDTRFELEKKRIDMEEEVDQLYARLEALEADREFLKQCFGSMKKGDKGIELLQEILHHLRDLRNVNLRLKNYTDNILL